jgi:hypothetical protein
MDNASEVTDQHNEADTPRRRDRDFRSVLTPLGTLRPDRAQAHLMPTKRHSRSFADSTGAKKIEGGCGYLQVVAGAQHHGMTPRAPLTAGV